MENLNNKDNSPNNGRWEEQLNIKTIYVVTQVS